jgi:2-phospho-L-lactate/phosphoenolpyruvate guanylyltransferase
VDRRAVHAPSSRTTAIVPLRSVAGGKTRLRRALPDALRLALVEAMFADVVDSLRRSPIENLVVAVGDPSAAAAARARGLVCRADPPGGEGLNDAIAPAMAHVPATERLLVVMPDLPWLRPSDVTELLASPAAITVAATDDGGTGGLACLPGARLDPHYGPGSARGHRLSGLSAGFTVASPRIPGFSFDVDDVDDVQLLLVESRQLGPAITALLPWLRESLAERRTGVAP